MDISEVIWLKCRRFDGGDSWDEHLREILPDFGEKLIPVALHRRFARETNLEDCFNQRGVGVSLRVGQNAPPV